MSDLTFLNEYVGVTVLAICLCVGVVIKSSIPKIDNKYIPLVMAVLGVLLNVWMNMQVSPEIVLGGLVSGLGSTGLHQAYKNLIGGEKNE